MRRRALWGDATRPNTVRDGTPGPVAVCSKLLVRRVREHCREGVHLAGDWPPVPWLPAWRAAMRRAASGGRRTRTGYRQYGPDGVAAADGPRPHLLVRLVRVFHLASYVVELGRLAGVIVLLGIRHGGGKHTVPADDAGLPITRLRFLAGGRGGGPGSCLMHSTPMKFQRQNLLCHFLPFSAQPQTA